MLDITKKQKIVSIILKLITILATTIGTIISYLSSANVFMGGHVIFMYFTIQSNIAIALVSLIGLFILLLNKQSNRIWNVIKLTFTVSITLTFAVFTFVLAPTLGNAWTLPNIITHLIAPLASIFDLIVIGSSLIFKKRDVIFVIFPPLAYAIYAGIGYINNWNFGLDTNYPYFFLNWGSEAGALGFSKDLPYMGTIYWIILLLSFIILIALLYIFIVGKISKKRNK